MPGSPYLSRSVRCSDSVTINGPNQALSSLRWKPEPSPKAAETGKQYSIFLNVTIVNTTGEIEKKNSMQYWLPGRKPDRYWLLNCWKCLADPAQHTEVSPTYPSRSDPAETEKSMFLSVRWRWRTRQRKKRHAGRYHKRETDIDPDLTFSRRLDDRKWKKGYWNRYQEDFITPRRTKRTIGNKEKMNRSLFDSTNLQFR